MTKDVITFLMSFLIHGNSALIAVSGLFKLLGFYHEKHKNFIMFIIQTNKFATFIYIYISIIFYITQIFLHVSMHPHYLQGILYFYFAKLQK
jgi:hypothetical protein